jgi:hypothetical protein
LERGKARNEYSILVGKRFGKRPLGRSRSTLTESISADVREVNCEDFGGEWTVSGLYPVSDVILRDFGY